ncbi:DUF2442 domain-containing protein [Nitrosomonas sp.]|uniref:DUF2442 domain-containing protein n=1 Tax=Nitrosomonas sp. TaxID=42353 RepID=UPI0026180E77|nr:DUF2442 domain-containing protein [Nitrosomonas sp.]
MSLEIVNPLHRTIGVTASASWRTRAVAVLPNYCLAVTCNDGTAGIIDMSQLILSEKAGIFAALKDGQLFSQVCIELGAITWPNGADLDPAWVYEEIGRNKIWCIPG